MYIPRDLIRIFKHVNDRVESERLSIGYVRGIYEEIHLFWKISVYTDHNNFYHFFSYFFFFIQFRNIFCNKIIEH